MWPREVTKKYRRGQQLNFGCRNSTVHFIDPRSRAHQPLYSLLPANLFVSHLIYSFAQWQMSTTPTVTAEKEKSIGDLIDEAVGINGPEDLLKLVLIGVSIAILVVAYFMSTMETFSMAWWSLLGFEGIAVLLCASCLYVVLIVLPTMPDKREETNIENKKVD